MMIGWDGKPVRIGVMCNIHWFQIEVTGSAPCEGRGHIRGRVTVRVNQERERDEPRGQNWQITCRVLWKCKMHVKVASSFEFEILVWVDLHNISYLNLSGELVVGAGKGNLVTVSSSLSIVSPDVYCPLPRIHNSLQSLITNQSFLNLRSKNYHFDE